MTSVANGKPILVIGGGLSGLVVARLLTRHDIPVIVFEQSSRDRSQGHGITLRDWAFEPLLQEMGGAVTVEELQRAVATDRGLGGTGWVDLSFRDNSSGETLFNPEPVAAGQKTTLFRANRSVLRDWLEEGLEVKYEHKLERLEGSPGQVKATFENGVVYDGTLLVAADGVHSTGKPEYQDNQIWNHWSDMILGTHQSEAFVSHRLSSPRSCLSSCSTARST